MIPLAEERCDECGARAYVRTIITTDGLTLTWCSHHFTKRQFELMARKYIIACDRRFELEALARPAKAAR